MIFTALKEHQNIRLDIFLHSKITVLSRTKIKNIISEGYVKINNLIVREPAKKIKDKDSVSIKIPAKKDTIILPQEIDIDILYEDKDVILINKPPGLVMHPGAGNKNNTLVNGLLYYYKNELSSVGGKLRPGIVHRIDKDTSGVIVVAKNDNAHINLSKQFSNHTIKRKYEALIWGSLRPQSGKIIQPISRNKKNRQLMSVNKFSGKTAITNYKTTEVYQNKNVPKISFIECHLETGRTHQIRVHMSYHGNGILGDKSYGKSRKKFRKINIDLEKKILNFDRQALHAKSLGFIHPKTGKKVFFEAPRPNDFEELIKTLRKSSI